MRVEMKRFLNASFMFGFMATALGCVNRPPVLQASVPLIDAHTLKVNYKYEDVSGNINNELSNAKVGDAIKINNKELSIERIYFSALGEHCIRMKNINQVNIVCKANGGAWKLLTNEDVK